MILINRLVALVVGAAFAAGGFLVVIEAIWTWTGSGFVWIPGREWLSSFKTTGWSDHVAVAISIGVAVAGFVLLVAELRPQRPLLARFETDHDIWLLHRRSTESSLARRLGTAVPTTPIKTRLTPRGHWRLNISARAAASTRPALEGAARGELERLHAPRAMIRVKTTGQANQS